MSPIALAEAVPQSFCALGALSPCLSRTPGRTGAPRYDPVGNDYIPIEGTTVLGLLTLFPAVHVARRSQAEVLFGGLSGERQGPPAQGPSNAPGRVPMPWWLAWRDASVRVTHPFALRIRSPWSAMAVSAGQRSC